MHILFLNHNRVWESTFNRGFYFGRSLVKRGHKVTLVANAKKSKFLFKEYECEGVNIIETPDLLWGQLRTGWDIINAFRRILYLKHKNYDIIHALDCRPTVIYPALYLKKYLRIPLVIDWADWWGRGGAIKLRKPRFLNKLFEPVETYFEENFRRYADFTTVISRLLEQRAIDLGISKGKIKYIPHGCDVETVRPIKQEEARCKVGLPLNYYILIFSGFVLYDADMVAKAFDLVLKEFPDTKLVLTGKKDILENSKSARNNNILNLGFVPKDKFLLYLASSDLCLMPLSDNLANRARFPGRIGDYMAAGRPIISNPVGEAGTIVKEYNLGIVTKPDALNFANGIIEALKDKDARMQWGINSRKLAENKFSFDILSREFEDVYNKVLKKN